MSALGQKRSFRPDRPRVRFAPKADIRQIPYGALFMYSRSSAVRAIVRSISLLREVMRSKDPLFAPP